MSIGAPENPPHAHSWEVITIEEGRPIEVVCECGTAWAIGGQIV